MGKIDIQGPDAAALLDFCYTNMFSTLKEGRVRYGLMLREDGYVMDDGTTARMGAHHYVMTTTTAAARIDLVPARGSQDVEGKESRVVNPIVARKGNQDDERSRTFVKAYQSEEVYQAALDLFKGGVVKGW